MHNITIAHRQFTCLSPTLVRIQFSPDGKFEERRSIVAHASQEPLAFKSQSKDGDWTVLSTGAIEIRTRDEMRPCDRNNLEIRWNDGRLMQIWRPGDRDYQNLGGTLRSLDRYAGPSCVLDGVHPATMDSPDASAQNWPAWLQCEVDPLYDKLHPAPPENLNKGHWALEVQREQSDRRYTERTFNWYKDARRFCPGVLSGAGYYFLNDSESAVMDADDFPIEREQYGAQDWYFFAYSRDYRQALRDFRLLSGPAPVPTHRSMGIIFSRWPAFTEAEVESMARDFAANGYPLSTLVMDMEWHTEGWGTWDFNPELIPDPARFFALCRKHSLEVTFNDHPLDLRGDDSHYEDYVAKAGPGVEIRERDYNGKTLKMAKVDITAKAQNRAFFEVCHTDIMALGLDYWWNDGSRGQMTATSGQLVTNKCCFEESERDGKRGMLLARYAGLGSHRYGAFFTGDASSDWHVLQLQCEFNIRAAGVGLSHVSHDIGGFVTGASSLQKNAIGVDIIDPILYARWLQFGVLGPILRFHSAPGCGSRLPYDYDELVGGACRKWLRIRHSLLPYFYTAAREFYDTGIPLTRGMFLDDPENPLAMRFDQYFCGAGLLVAPILDAGNSREVYLPAGDWFEFETAKTLEGGRVFQRTAEIDEAPVYVPAGTILPRRDPDAPIHAGHVDPLVLDVYPGANGTASLYEDDGRSDGYKSGVFCRSQFRLEGGTLTGEVEEGQPLGATRGITILWRATTKPARAVLNGKIELPVIEGGEGFSISLPALPSSDRWQLTLS